MTYDSYASANNDNSQDANAPNSKLHTTSEQAHMHYLKAHMVLYESKVTAFKRIKVKQR